MIGRLPVQRFVGGWPGLKVCTSPGQCNLCQMSPAFVCNCDIEIGSVDTAGVWFFVVKKKKKGFEAVIFSLKGRSDVRVMSMISDLRRSKPF